jgi:hypothetical protein
MTSTAAGNANFINARNRAPQSGALPPACEGTSASPASGGWPRLRIPVCEGNAHAGLSESSSPGVECSFRRLPRA